MPNGYLMPSITFKKLTLFLAFSIIIVLKFQFSHATLVIGALFSNEHTTSQHSNTSLELNEETVFKHAVYISNQYKFSFINAPPNSPTLLYKTIHVNKIDQLKTVKKVCKETSGNIVALVGPHDDAFKLYIKSMCHQLDIIHFDIDPALEPSYSFNIYPSLDVLCTGFADLIKKFGWKHVAILYDPKSNLKKVRCLLGGPAQAIPKLDLTLKIANGDYRSILRDISRRRITNIILDLQPEEAQVVLKMALQLGMINSTYHYVLTTLDIETMNLDDYKYNRANITAFSLVKTYSPFYKSISLNLTDYYPVSGGEKTNTLLYTRNALLFDTIFTLAAAIKEAEKSLDLNNGNVSCVNNRGLSYGRLLNSFVDKVTINGLTGYISFENKQRKDFEVDVLQLKETGLYKCGTWSPKQRLNFTFYDEVYEDDALLSKKNSFRVVTLVEEPYVMEEDGKFKGFCIDILDEIAAKMNFKYTIYKVADNQYGSEDENGTWNGMIRELIDKKADLAVSALTINFKRQQVCDFTKPFISLGISILYKVPTSKKPGLFSFLNPLSLEIWIYTLVTYVLVSLIMMVLARFSPYEWRNTHPCNMNNEYVENQFTAWNSLWFAVGTLMQQGSDINPKAFSTRLVGGVWWFFTLIIISSYTANLAAFLTVEKVDIPIHNVEDLANQSKISYGLFKGGSTMNFFKESRIDTYKRMWNAMQSNPEASFASSNKEGVDRVMTKDYAYLMESTFIDYVVQRNCNLTQIGGLLDSKGYGIATQLGSPYTDDISLKILEMQEKGEIQKFYNRWWKGGGTCVRDEKKDSKASPLNVENVGGIFVVLIGGVFLAVIVSLFEFCYYAKRHASKIKKPLLRQMADEFKFAIKCGSSTKKIQNSTTTAVPIKKKPKRSDSSVMPLTKSGAPNAAKKNVIKKSKSASSIYDECKRTEELLEGVTPQNAIVCKNKSSSSLSVVNPGLLIVEKDDDFDNTMAAGPHYQQYPMGVRSAPRTSSSQTKKPQVHHQFPKQRKHLPDEQILSLRLKSTLLSDDEEYDNANTPSDYFIQETSFDSRTKFPPPQQQQQQQSHHHQSRRQVQHERPVHRQQPKPQASGKHQFPHQSSVNPAALFHHGGRNLEQEQPYDDSEDYENNSSLFEQDHLLNHPKMPPLQHQQQAKAPHQSFPVVHSNHSPHGQRHHHRPPHGQPSQHNQFQSSKEFYLENKPIPIHYDDKKPAKSPKNPPAGAKRHRGGFGASNKISRGGGGGGDDEDDENYNHNEENSEENGTDLGDQEQERHEYEQETINYERFVKKSNIKKPVSKNRPNR